MKFRNIKKNYKLDFEGGMQMHSSIAAEKSVHQLMMCRCTVPIDAEKSAHQLMCRFALYKSQDV